MKKKMKIYVLMLSKVFPATHPRKGEPTNFKVGLLNALYIHNPSAPIKLHTIRCNYELWRKRFEEIDEGNACLSIRQWMGKPYASKQREIARLTKEDGIGLQMLEFYNGCLQQPILSSGITIRAESLAKNDGLSFEDWKAWFKDYELTKQLAIIHFTKFRY